MPVRILGVLDAEGDVGIAPHVEVFGAAFGAVDDDMRPIDHIPA